MYIKYLKNNVEPPIDNARHALLIDQGPTKTLYFRCLCYGISTYIQHGFLICNE